VEHTKAASEEALLGLLLGRLDRMLALGTTLAESKSGYGLETDTELKMLRVLRRADETHAVDLASNFCGAHSVPRGSTAAEAARDIVERQLPELARQRAAGVVNPTLIDVFMEKGVFDAASTEAILRAGSAAGLEHNFHGDELSHQGAAELAGALGSLAVSHLECVSGAGIAALARRPTIAVLLPTTAYILRLEHPPARRMLAAGVPLALGSDFNPNAHCLSMPLVMHMACVNMRLTMPEALCAATLNAAASMGRSRDHGSLEVGKWGDVLLLDAETWEHLIYQMPPPIAAVFKKGKRVNRG
jgi:imidazolonepropionase